MSRPQFDQLIGGAGVTKKLIAAGHCLFRLGDACENFVFINSGQVRVELLSSQGHQLLLYRIRDGESCVMTTACLIGNNYYSAQAITETQVDLTLITRAAFHACMKDSPEFRDFIFDGFADRLAALMQKTAELATWPIDRRLIAALVHHAEALGAEAPLSLTHQQLAVEVGTAREVISRRLSALEQQGIITRQVGAIEICDMDALKKTLDQ